MAKFNIVSAILIQLWYIQALKTEKQINSSSTKPLQINQQTQISTNQNVFDGFEVKILESQKKKCNSSGEERRPEFCPTFFDGILCWQQTRAGETILQSCPPLKGFYDTENANKRCNKSGVWEATDFTPCFLSEESKLNFKVRNIIAHLGYGSSGILLTASVVIMLYFPRLRCPRNTIHVHLFFSFLLRIIGFVFNTVASQKIIIICRMSTILSYFGIVSSYTWIFVEALFLHNVIIVHTMTEPQKFMHIYVTIGWTMPFVMTIICFILKYMWQTPKNMCWTFIQPPERWLYIYTATLVLANFGIFVNVMRVLYLKMQVQPTSAANRKLLKSTFILVVVFGIYYIITAPIDIVAATVKIQRGTVIDTVQLYFEQILESFQGSFVAILFCFVNSEVLAEIKRKFNNYRGNSTQRSQAVSLINNESSKIHTLAKTKVNGHHYGEESITLKLIEDAHPSDSHSKEKISNCQE